MSNDLSLTDYIASKDRLRDAIKRDPIHTATYEVQKYCRIAVGESKELKEYHSLKPKQKITIQWRYSDAEELPDPLNVTLPSLTESANTFQTGEKLLKWIKTNARELK